ncbi:MAG TPA: hypothetical protein DCQ92_06350, partial [Verrucomicrobia subdivision 3 bacterium]|nr:hypothetical protein [Limisphaerales bacterium]
AYELLRSLVGSEMCIRDLWSAICNHRPADINAMTLATVDQNGKPSTRTVLLKTVDERGFVFFTNYDSRKGCELAENPNA